MWRMSMMDRAVPMMLLVGTLAGCATASPDQVADLLSLGQPQVDKDQVCWPTDSPGQPGDVLDTGELAAAVERFRPPDGGIVLGLSTDSAGTVSRWHIAETTWRADVAEGIQALTHPLIHNRPKVDGRILIRTAAGRLAELETGPSLACRPSLLNGREVGRSYQQVWEQTGLAGTATIWFFIDSTGIVTNARINRSSGNAHLDRLLLDVAEVMEFRPARWDGKADSIWVSLPITVEARCPAPDNWAAWAKLARTHPCWRQRDAPAPR